MAKPKNIKEQILTLRAQGKSYNEICDILKCSKGTVCYHCCDGQKQKQNARLQLRRKNNPLIAKIECFNHCKIGSQERLNIQNTTQKRIYLKLHGFYYEKGKNNQMITLEQFLEKVGPNPKCYLTGTPIDLSQPGTYQLDHIIPVSRGGTNDISNLGLTTKQANKCKSDMTDIEFIEFCKKVALNNK